MFVRRCFAGDSETDLTRSTIYILLPLSTVVALVLVSQGVVQNFKPYPSVALLQPTSIDEPVIGVDGKPSVDVDGKAITQRKEIAEQVLPMGPVASQVAIKQLGTNGSGYFNVNSAHPFDSNPTMLIEVVEEIIGSAIHQVREQLAQHVVEIHLPPALPLVHVDGVLFEQVFVNLLENAARYSPAGSRIEITAREIMSGVEIRITDNGPGLKPGIEEHLFEKFVRGNATSPDSRRGVGLGLAICRGIVQAHACRTSPSRAIKRWTSWKR